MKKDIYYMLSAFLFLMLIIQACIEEYQHTGIAEIAGMLVIEGVIQSDTTIAKLSKSIGTNDYAWAIERIPDAQVYVECDDGVMYGPGKYIGEGTYRIANGKLGANQQYRLFVRVDEKEYASEFLHPLSTPEIDELSYDKEGNGMPVIIYVSTHDSNDKTPYYRWKYTEHWELHAELFANAGWETVNGVDTLILYDRIRNIYYCWGRDSAKSLILGYTTHLSENRIHNRKITEIEPSAEKLSVLYYIEVEQMKLREEAYNYFYLMQKNLEQTGGLFSSMPSSIKGNILCLSDPKEEVIGYIEVTEITKKDMYIPNSRELYEPSYSTYCMDNIKYNPLAGFPMYLYGDGGPVAFAPRTCFDCRSHPNASKTKPPFWPTDKL